MLSLQRSSVHIKLKDDLKKGDLSPFSPVSWLEHYFALKLYTFAQTKMAYRYLVLDLDDHKHLYVS